MVRRMAPLLVLLLLVGITRPAVAVDVIPASVLAVQCQDFLDEQPGAKTDYCVHYVQGFIDGAVTTDVRVMLNVEARYESLTERAARTRMRGWHAEQMRRAAGFAEFCLGNPVPLEEVVHHVATTLVQLQAPDGPARDAVYSALRQHYPC